MLTRTTLTFEQIEAALDAGKLEMQRPWGDWVRCRRRAVTTKCGSDGLCIPVYMENQVEASVTTFDAGTGFAGVRIAE